MTMKTRTKKMAMTRLDEEEKDLSVFRKKANHSYFEKCQKCKQRAAKSFPRGHTMQCRSFASGKERESIDRETGDCTTSTGRWCERKIEREDASKENLWRPESVRGVIDSGSLEATAFSEQTTRTLAVACRERAQALESKREKNARERPVLEQHFPFSSA